MGHEAGEGFYIDIMNMNASIEELVAMATDIITDVEELNNIANASKQTWSGSARDIFDSECVIWNEACDDMTKKLNLQTQVLGDMNYNYQTSDQRGADIFDGAGRP